MKKTVLKMLRTCVEKYPDTLYTSNKIDGGWVGMKVPEVIFESRHIASGLMEMGVKKGDNLSMI